MVITQLSKINSLQPNLILFFEDVNILSEILKSEIFIRGKITSGRSHFEVEKSRGGMIRKNNYNMKLWC